jgi:protein-tyrosine phosphatase
MVSVCFVCLGNICRSPTAEGVMTWLLESEGLAELVAVDSAGTAAYHAGELPDSRSRAAAGRRGIALEHRARQFQAQDWGRFDLVLAMDRDNLADLTRSAPDEAARTKLRLLRSFDPSALAGASVPDPYYGGAEGFDEVLDQCERACRGLIAWLRQEKHL